MSKCDTCGRRAYGYLCDGCIHDPDNKDLYEPMTNADRIRAMTDEELAYWVMCPHDEPPCDGKPERWDCMACTLKWLKQNSHETCTGVQQRVKEVVVAENATASEEG